MKKLETGNIETGNTSTLATFSKLLAAVVLLASGGCQSMKENGMLSPRSGELFQTTKLGTGVVASCCVFPTAMGWLAMQEGHLIGLPVAIIFSPFAIVAPVLDLGVVSPLTDLACLPYDLSQPQHGFYIRIVDEDGKPIPGARISGSVVNDESSHLLSTTDFSGMTDEAGEFYVGRLFKCKGSVEAKAPGYSAVRRTGTPRLTPVEWICAMNVGAPTVTAGMPRYSAAMEEPASLVVHRPHPQLPEITASIPSF